MQKVDFIFLHGFLGVPSDWDDVIENVKVDLEEAGIEGVFHAPDYFNRPNLGPKNSLDKVAGEFTNWVTSSTHQATKILVGYSLGGRLALHIFEKSPNLFSRLVCVSTHPGLKVTQYDEIKERDSRDLFWSELFLNHSWPELVQKWNEQEIFQGSNFEPERDAASFRRDLLSKALINWSLAKQTDKRNVARRYVKKITWVVGEKDKKFLALTRALLTDVLDLEIDIVPAAGHRVLFDNSFELARCISSKISK